MEDFSFFFLYILFGLRGEEGASLFYSRYAKSERFSFRRFVVIFVLSILTIPNVTRLNVRIFRAYIN